MQTDEQQAPARRSLRQIVDELLTLIEDVEGEVNDEIDQLELSVEQKVEAYAAVDRQWAAEQMAFKDLEHAYKEKAARREQLRDKLRERLQTQLQRLGVETLKTKTVTASFRTTESVEIADEASFIGAYRSTPLVRTKESPDKAAIKAILDSGVKVSFASIKTTRSLQLR